MDSAIHWTNLYPVDSTICFSNVYPLDSYLSNGKRYPTFEHQGLELVFPVVSTLEAGCRSRVLSWRLENGFLFAYCSSRIKVPLLLLNQVTQENFPFFNRTIKKCLLLRVIVFAPCKRQDRPVYISLFRSAHETPLLSNNLLLIHGSNLKFAAGFV